MNEKLNIITEKLYNDGVVKAKEDAEKILQEAKLQAKEIVDKANSQATEIVNTANKKSEDLKKKVEAELRLAGDQAIASIKQRIVSMLADDISKKITTKSFDDVKFVENLILTIAEKWKSDEGLYNLNLILSAEMKKDTESFFSAKGKEFLDKGVDVRFDEIDAKGFIVSPHDGSYQINFTDEVFMNFFSDYLRGFTKKLLFEN